MSVQNEYDAIAKYMAQLEKLRTLPPGEEYNTLSDAMGETWKCLTSYEIAKFKKENFSTETRHHNMKRLVVLVVGKGMGFMYDADPFSPLAPQIAQAVENAKTSDASHAMVMNEDGRFVGVVERPDIV